MYMKKLKVVLEKHVKLKNNIFILRYTHTRATSTLKVASTPELAATLFSTTT